MTAGSKKLGQIFFPSFYIFHLIIFADYWGAIVCDTYHALWTCGGLCHSCYLLDMPKGLGQQTQTFSQHSNTSSIVLDTTINLYTVNHTMVLTP
jgi:hypothetical protein